MAVLESTTVHVLRLLQFCSGCSSLRTSCYSLSCRSTHGLPKTSCSCLVYCSNNINLSQLNVHGRAYLPGADSICVFALPICSSTAADARSDDKAGTGGGCSLSRASPCSTSGGVGACTCRAASSAVEAAARLASSTNELSTSKSLENSPATSPGTISPAPWAVRFAFAWRSWACDASSASAMAAAACWPASRRAVSFATIPA